MTALILRAPTPADIPALSALGIAAFVHKFGDLYRPEDLLPFLAQTHSEAALRRELANPANRYQIATRAGLILGWCKLTLACGFPQHARTPAAIELKQLYTAPNASRGGIGSALMDWALSESAAHKASEIQLSVWSNNEAAQRFYARYGFTKVADVHFRVGEQLDHEFLFARMV